MGETRREALLRELDARLAATDVALAERYPGPAPGRHPVHTVYVPADRYDAGAVADWGEAGAAALAEHGGDDAELAAVLGIPVAAARPGAGRVAAKLRREPWRTCGSTSRTATAAAPTPRRTPPPRPPGRCSAPLARRARRRPSPGLRCKSLEADTRARAVRTLDLFLEAYLAAGGDPAP